ncbi:MAG: mechanosensitive ion channel [Alphaproteobacteria bacterium]|nr:mechanosensitive ion channel [Alphaproteobacteria bacterium]
MDIAASVGGWLQKQWPDGVFGIGIAVAVFLVLLRLRGWLAALLKRHESSGSLLHIFARMLGATSTLFLLLVAFRAGLAVWDGSPTLSLVVGSALVIFGFIQVALWAQELALTLIGDVAARQSADAQAIANASSVLIVFARFVIWSLAFLLILDNLGIDVTALIAGLGIGGIAIGLAAQSIFSDLFGSLSIILDRPFVKGDFIVVDAFMGTIERVGLKTTRIRALSGEQIVIANSKLLDGVIHNYQRLHERRVVFGIGITYETPAALVKEVPQLLRTAVEDAPETRFDRAHFKSYGDFALLFEVVYYVKTPDYNRYMDVQQIINETIFETFAAKGIAFAYPTQTLHVVRPNAA